MNNTIIAGIASLFVSLVCMIVSVKVEAFEMFAAGFFLAAVYWILMGMLQDRVDTDPAQD